MLEHVKYPTHAEDDVRENTMDVYWLPNIICHRPKFNTWQLINAYSQVSRMETKHKKL